MVKRRWGGSSRFFFLSALALFLVQYARLLGAGLRATPPDHGVPKGLLPERPTRTTTTTTSLPSAISSVDSTSVVEEGRKATGSALSHMGSPADGGASVQESLSSKEGAGTHGSDPSEVDSMGLPIVDHDNWWKAGANGSSGPPPVKRLLPIPTFEELASSCPPRLEFLHIPKSGGTTIEKAGFQQGNIAWGCCHFHLNLKEPWKDLCPTYLAVNYSLWPKHKKLNDLWHYPLHWLSRNRTLFHHRLPANPYHNLPAIGADYPIARQQRETMLRKMSKNKKTFRERLQRQNITDDHHFSSAARPPSVTCPPSEQELHFFAVVRDPYARAISEFYFQAGIAHKRTPEKLNEPGFLNRWIMTKLKEYDQFKADTSLSWNGKMLHWVPQAEYVFDDQGRRRVRHLLRFEHLAEDFGNLTKRYGLNVTLSDAPKTKSGGVQASDRMGPANLTRGVRQALETHFADDFALGSYPRFYDPNEDSDGPGPQTNSANHNN